MTNYDYLYDKSYYGDELYDIHLEEKELTWVELENITVLPFKIMNNGADTSLSTSIGGGLIDSIGTYIDGTGLHRGLGCSYDFDEANVIERDDVIVFLGLWPQIWGHVITDNIRRLWVLYNETFMEKYRKCKFVYIPYMNQKLGNNNSDFLEILGVDLDRLESSDEGTRFKKVVLPDECFWRRSDGPRGFLKDYGTRLYTKEYIELIDKVRNYGENHFKKDDFEKIYCTHRKYSSYREMGERKLEGYFKSLGYRIVAPEELSFENQLNMFLNCKSFVSTAGSVSHNILFLRDNTEVILIPRANFITEYQLAIDSVHNLDITYVDSSFSLFVNHRHPWGGPFFYVVSNELQKYFGKNIKYKFDKFRFWIYKELSLVMNGSCNSVEYYEKVVDRYISYEIKNYSRKGIIYKLCSKLRVQKILALLFK